MSQRKKLSPVKQLKPLQQMIVKARKESGLSQDALARELGVAVRTIARWENNRQPAKPGVLRLLRGFAERHNHAELHDQLATMLQKYEPEPEPPSEPEAEPEPVAAAH